jgi:hypothetical protein
MADPFTIRIYVPDGDPEGVRIIDRMNWTGLGVVVPRERWPETRKRTEFNRPGVYILVGSDDDESETDDDRRTIYIGQADGLRDRIDQHAKAKEFWDWMVAFVSTNNGLNRAHILWLEYALFARAKDADRARLDNGQVPTEPAMSESERADTQAFLKEILQILPLLGLRELEPRSAVADPDLPQSIEQSQLTLQTENDTVIVPAKREGFEKVFLGEKQWRAIRISGGMRPKLRWIAAYQSQPIKAITHIAEIDRIEPYGDGGKYAVIFKGAAQALDHPIPFGDAPSGYMQGIRYTKRNKLLAANKVTDLFKPLAS